MIGKDTAQKIKAAADIVEVISGYVPLKKFGREFRGRCPFHNGRNPSSFAVYPDSGGYYSFTCHEKGDVVSFIEKQESKTYPEALEFLASKYGVEIPRTRLSKEEQRLQQQRESLFALNSWACDYFIRQMNDTPEGESVAKSYLHTERQFTDATIEKFSLGYAPRKSETLTYAALKAGYKKEFLLQTGLSSKNEASGSLADKFKGRVIFPIHNISGRVVGFGGRILSEGEQKRNGAKYLNSRNSDIYSKRKELYGLYFAQKAIQKQGFVIMVEGYADVISMHQSGVENVVASCGTALTSEQINLLKRYTKDIVLMYDGDKAGKKASLEGIDLILEHDMNVRVVLLPEPEDPDSYARKHTPEQTIGYVEDNAESFIAFKAKLLMEFAAGDPVRKSEAIWDIVGSIAKIQDPIKRRMFVVECSKVLGDVDEQMLMEAVSKKSK